MKVTIKWKRVSYLIALKIGTQKGGAIAHLGAKFGNNFDKHSQSYSRFTKNNTNMLSRPQGKPRIEQEAENWHRSRLTIEPQTFCGLKEIELKTMKIQQKNQQYVIITRSRITATSPRQIAQQNHLKMVCGRINQL